MKILMLENVRPDFLFLAKPGTILRAGKTYEATVNKNGAVTAICENGETLGVKPGEFETVQETFWFYRKNALPDVGGKVAGKINFKE